MQQHSEKWLLGDINLLWDLTVVVKLWFLSQNNKMLCALTLPWVQAVYHFISFSKVEGVRRGRNTAIKDTASEMWSWWCDICVPVSVAGLQLREPHWQEAAVPGLLLLVWVTLQPSWLQGGKMEVRLHGAVQKPQRRSSLVLMATRISMYCRGTQIVWHHFAAGRISVHTQGLN